MDLIPSRNTSITPWQPSRLAAARDQVEVRSVSLTTVTLTRARPVERPRPHEDGVRPHQWTRTHGTGYASRRSEASPRSAERGPEQPQGYTSAQDDGWARSEGSAFDRDLRPQGQPQDHDAWTRSAYSRDLSRGARDASSFEEHIDGEAWVEVEARHGPSRPDLESSEEVLERIARRYFGSEEPTRRTVREAAWKHTALTPLPTEGYLSLREFEGDTGRRYAISAFEKHRKAS